MVHCTGFQDVNLYYVKECSKGWYLVAVFLELPVSIVQGAHLTCLQPTANAVEVKCVVTHTPSNCAFLTGLTCLISLTLNTKIHNMVPADSTVINYNIPGPQSNSIPFLDLKPLLLLAHGRWTCRNLAVTVNLHF